MKKHFLLSVSLIIVLFTVSCSKDSGGGSTVTPTASKSDLLTKPIWKLTGWTLDPALPFTSGGPAIANWYAQLDNCGKDDIYKFNTTGNYAFEEGATKCSPNDPTIWESGLWKFNTTSTVIIMTETAPGTDSYEFKLSELTAAKLVLIREFKSGNIVYTSTQTFAPN